METESRSGARSTRQLCIVMRNAAFSLAPKLTTGALIVPLYYETLLSSVRVNVLQDVNPTTSASCLPRWERRQRRRSFGRLVSQNNHLNHLVASPGKEWRFGLHDRGMASQRSRALEMHHRGSGSLDLLPGGDRHDSHL